MSNGSKDERRGNITGGVIVLGIGLYFLLVNMDVLPAVGDSWPIFLVIVGGALIIGSFFRKSRPTDQMNPPPPPPPP